MIDSLLDACLDTLKLLPYLFITFFILELIEHKLNKKSLKVISKYKKTGPLFGGIIGAFPQCGFSAMGANLYASNIITRGTLIAIFLSTSDEMLPILIGEGIKSQSILIIVGFKILSGIIIGLFTDLILKSKNNKNSIKDFCTDENCHCKEGLFISSLIHTFKTSLFILIANILINIVILNLGVNSFTNLLKSKNILVYFIASLIGLIPNCAASIILTEVYVAGLSSLGVTLAGLLTGSGIGILLLFKSNKNLKDNFTILSIIYFTGVFLGFIFDLIF